MDDHGCSGAYALSIEDLMDEYASRPPQIAEWLWCIEYVAKFVKDLGCILDLMNMGYQYSGDYGFRISEVLSLRILEFMFDPSEYVGVASTSEARVEFDLSMSNTDVLREILKEIPVSELRAGMPELSKFNPLPFIAHKNMCVPQCALEKLRELSLLEHQSSAAPSTDANEPVLRDDRSVQMDTCEEDPIPTDEQQVHTGLEQNINEEDKVIVTEDEDEPMHISEKDEVIVIYDDTETIGEPISDDRSTGESFTSTSRRCSWPEDARVKCTPEGTWLISESDDDESDVVDCPALAKTNTNTYTNALPSSSRIRPENRCWKCGIDGALLICSRSECALKVHKECLKCPINLDEDGHFHCPVCWYDRVVNDYLESLMVMSSSKKRALKFLSILSRVNKRTKASAATSV